MESETVMRIRAGGGIDLYGVVEVLDTWVDVNRGVYAGIARRI